VAHMKKTNLFNGP